MVKARMAGGVSLAGMALALAGASVLVQRLTPSSLIVPPDRPYQAKGNPSVRTEGARYPRAAVGADEVRTSVAAPARRIVSQYWSTDEFLYAVVPPERVVGVSDSAYQMASSNVRDLVERFRPIVATDPERVLRADPDLVFTPETARADAPAVLRAAGLSVYRIFTTYETLASIEDHIRVVGYLTGEDERAAAEVKQFQDAVARAAARRPAGVASPRVLGLGGLYTYGSRTLFSDILRVLGAENVAATNGLVNYDRANDERILRWNPDWILAGASPGMEDQVRARLLARPAVAATSAAKGGRIVVFDNRVFLPLSPMTTRLVDAISVALYGPPAS